MNTHSLDLESGSSQYAAANDSASTSITGNMTIEAWVKFESFSSNTMTIVGKYHTGSGQQSYIFYYDGVANQIILGISSNGGNVNFGIVAWTPNLGQWYHVSVVYTTAGTADFYVDTVQQGAQQTGLNTSIFNSTEKMAIGAVGPNGGAGGFFDGLIDEVRLWATNRSQANIAADWKQELVGNETNLNGYWKLNNDYLDETANNNDLTASGSPSFSTDVPPWETPSFLAMF
jgi:hypothetical protein